MAQLSVTLKGKDELTNTIKAAKQSLNDLNNTGTNSLGQIAAKFKSIESSGKPLKSQLREMQKLLADMNMGGLSNTSLYTEIAQKAGQMKDAISDAATSVNRFANDTMNLKAAADALSVVASGASIATGAMGLFGIENDNVKQAILRVQSAMAILNGVQSISNALNKDSALLQKAKQIYLKAEAALQAKAAAAQAAKTAATRAGAVAEAAQATATVASTAATGAQTAASKLATVAQWAWNEAVAANPVTALVTVLLAAVAAYEIYKIRTDESAASQKAAADTTHKLLEAFADAAATGAKARLEMEAYIQAIDNFNGSAQEEKKLIDEINQKYGEHIGYVSTLGEAKAALADSGYYYIRYLEEEAKATAMAAAYADVYRKQVMGEISYSDAQAQIERIKSYWGMAAENVRFYAQQMRIANRIAGRSTVKPSKSTGGKHGGTGGKHGGTTTTKTPEVEAAAGSVEALEKQISEIEEKLKKGLVQAGSDAEKQLREQLDELKKKLQAEKIRLGFETDPKLEEIKKYVDEATNLTNEADKAKSDARSSYYKRDDHALYTEAIENNLNPKTGMDAITGDLEGLHNSITELQAYRDALSDVLEERAKALKAAGIAKTLDPNEANIELFHAAADAYEEQAAEVEAVESVLTSLQGKYEETAQAALIAAEKMAIWEAKKKDIEDYTDAIGSLGDAFGSLGDMIKSAGDESGAAFIEAFGAILNGVSEIIPQVMKLIALKQAEALASGVAGAASLPFPASLPAIAAIVATLMGVFAQISSLKFAEGGIVPGTSYSGDHVHAMLNSGELVLTRRQTANLFNLLDRGGVYGTGGTQQITLKVRGSDLYGALSNYNNINRKTTR